MQVKRLPISLTPETARYHSARSCHQHQRSGKDRDGQHVCHPGPAMPVLAGPCHLNECWPLSQRQDCSGMLALALALRYKDVCMRDLRAEGFNPEVAALDRCGWRTTTRAVNRAAETVAEEGSISESKSGSQSAQPQTRRQKPAFTRSRCSS